MRSLLRPARHQGLTFGVLSGARVRVERLRSPGWADRLVPALLFVAALALYLPRLTVPSWYSHDELGHAFTAAEYLEGNAAAWRWDTPCSGREATADLGMLAYCPAYDPDATVHGAPGYIGQYEWSHPPLGRYAIAAGILLFGDNAFGWRVGSAVFGALGIALAYRLGLALTRRRAVAVLTAGLLLVDGLYFVYSRRGLLDIYVTVAMLAALLAFAGYLVSPPDRVHRPLILIGVCMGLGIATKWNAAYASALIGGVALWRLAGLWRAARRGTAGPAERAGLRAHLVWVPTGLVLIPLAVYLVAHVPYFLEGYGLPEFFELQRQKFRGHASAAQTLPYSSRWWQWPLALRPVFLAKTADENGNLAQTYANGNPLLYWAFLPAVLWVGWRWWRTRNPALPVLLIGFGGQWLPWAFVDRASFVYHFLPAAPFGCLAVAIVVAALRQAGTGWRRGLAVGYVVLVVAAFAFFYPIYASVPLDGVGLERRMWLPSWR